MARTILNIGDGTIGTIKISKMTESQFQSINGTNWILADGRSVSGSKYETIVGESSIPDLRGLYIRFKNNGQTGTWSNPDGDLSLGTLQDENYANHGHSVDSMSAEGDHAHGMSRFNTQVGGLFGINMDFGTWRGMSVAGSHNHTIGVGNSSPGGNETTCKSMTLNAFIKID